MRRTILSATLLGGTFALATAQPPAADPKPTQKFVPMQTTITQMVPVKAAKPATLEEDIARAVQSHPDVLVAEAEAQLANAKLQQTKQAVAQRVAAAKREKDRAAGDLGMSRSKLEIVQRSVQTVKLHLDRLQQLQKAGQAPAGEIAIAQQEFDKAKLGVLVAEQALAAEKAKLANAEADYEALVGTAAANKSIPFRVRIDPLGDEKMANLDPRLFGFYLALEQAPPKPGSVADKLRKGLSAPITFGCKNQLIEQVVEGLKKAAGLDVIVRTPKNVANTPVLFTFENQELPLSAWLELIRDEIDEVIIFDNKPDTGKKQPGRTSSSGNVDWYVREYGLLLSEYGRPDGAPTLAEFMKATRAEKPTEPKK